MDKELVEFITGFVAGMSLFVLLSRFIISDYVVNRLNGRYMSKADGDDLRRRVDKLLEHLDDSGAGGRRDRA